MSARLEVRALLAAKITSLGYTALEYRDEDDAALPGDIPFVLIQQAGSVEITRAEYMAGGTETHEASFFFSFAAESRDDAEAMMVAAVAAFAADPTLGGQIQDIRPVGYGDEETEARDYAAIVLENRVQFCTAPGDWSALLY
jgi:hypothetical protein